MVLLNGYKVGHVSEIRFDKDNVNRIVVEISLDENVRLPVGTAMLIKSSSLVSGIKDLKLLLGEGPGFHEPGDTLIAAMEKDLTELIGAYQGQGGNRIDPYRLNPGSGERCTGCFYPAAPEIHPG